MLKGAVILVTGGAKGLGLAISTYLKDQEANVVVADIDQEGLALISETFDCHRLDVTKLEDARAVAQKIVEKHGRIDALINNAGVIYSEPMVNIMNPDQMMHDYGRFRDSILINMDSVFIMTSAVAEQMVLNRIKGCIVNISSIAASGNEGQTAYSAAKAGVNAMTVTWSKELGRLGIRCNAVAPGFIGTDSTHSALNESILKHITSNTPLKRLGDAEDVAQAVASLITNKFINGAVLDVNGGLTI